MPIMHDAVKSGDMNKVKAIFMEIGTVNGAPQDTANAERDIANAIDNEGRTPLLLAVERNFIDIMAILFQHGAMTNQANENGNTPLHIAVRNGFFDASIMLLMNQASINVQTNHGETPLQLAEARQLEIANERQRDQTKIDAIMDLLQGETNLVTIRNIVNSMEYYCSSWHIFNNAEQKVGYAKILYYYRTMPGSMTDITVDMIKSFLMRYVPQAEQVQRAEGMGASSLEHDLYGLLDEYNWSSSWYICAVDTQAVRYRINLILPDHRGPRIDHIIYSHQLEADEVWSDDDRSSDDGQPMQAMNHQENWLLDMLDSYQLEADEVSSDDAQPIQAIDTMTHQGCWLSDMLVNIGSTACIVGMIATLYYTADIWNDC